MINNYYKGKPCDLNGVFGKIVGESEAGSWGEINGEKMWSIPLFCTPHGTVIKTGVAYLDEITPSGLQQLEELEKQAKEKGNVLYAGYLE